MTTLTAKKRDDPQTPLAPLWELFIMGAILLYFNIYMLWDCIQIGEACPADSQCAAKLSKG